MKNHEMYYLNTDQNYLCGKHSYLRIKRHKAFYLGQPSNSFKIRRVQYPYYHLAAVTERSTAFWIVPLKLAEISVLANYYLEWGYAA